MAASAPSLALSSLIVAASPSVALSSSSSVSVREKGFLGTRLQCLSLRPQQGPFRARRVQVQVRGQAAVAAEELDAEVATRPVPRLKKFYLEKVVPLLQEEYKYKNSQEIPHVKKIVINCGVGEAAQNAKALESTIRDLSLIAGQRPVTTRAKKAIAGFKLRAGVAVGVSLTLRGEVMYSFLDRLMNLALPRTRDFQGVNPYSFDGKGNYTLGLPEQSVFPEIRFENIDKERGMDVSIISTAKNDTEGQKLLALLGMPFKEGTGRSAAAARRRAKDVYRGLKTRKR